MNMRMEAILPYNMHSLLDTIFGLPSADSLPVWDGIFQFAVNEIHRITTGFLHPLDSPKIWAFSNFFEN